MEHMAEKGNATMVANLAIITRRGSTPLLRQAKRPSLTVGKRN